MPHPARPPRRFVAPVVAVALVLAVLASACGGSGDDGEEAAGSPTTTSDPATDPSTTVGTEPPTTTTAVPAPPAPGPCDTGGWDLERRLRSLVFASLGSADPAELRAAVDAGVGGIFVSSAAVPLVASGELATATAATVARPAPLVAIDEEGGRVQRLRDVLGPLPSARRLAELEPAELRARAAAHGTAMRELGITVDFAPVVDLDGGPAEGAIGDRSFSADPVLATSAAEAFAAGLLDAGVTPTLKHFPGHGATTGDSHDAQVVTLPLDQLGDHLAPYREALPRLPGTAVMVGHLVVPGLTGDEPATTSPAAVDGLLRGELGFTGLVVSDDLEGMEAVQQRYTTAEAAVLAVDAGIDMPLVPASRVDEVVAALASAVGDGRLTDVQVTTSADRVQAARDPAC